MKPTESSRFSSTVCTVLAAILSTLACPSCDRSLKAGGGGNADGSVSSPDSGETPPTCGPQQAGEDIGVQCTRCAYCEDTTPYQWIGNGCRFMPICCACKGADCRKRFATLSDCMDSYGRCPRALLEAHYPSARLIWEAPAGADGSGPAMEIDGYGRMRTWEQCHGILGSDAQKSDYEEDLGIEAANELFGLLAAVDFGGLPHPNTGWIECYPVLWLQWDDCDGCGHLQMSYVSAGDLRPELDTVYDWLDRRLCRPNGNPDYPSTLPSDYCAWDYLR